MKTDTEAQNRYTEVLRKMTMEQKALKVFELTEMTRMLLKESLKMQFPEKSPEEIHRMFLKRLDECHNSNY